MKKTINGGIIENSTPIIIDRVCNVMTKKQQEQLHHAIMGADPNCKCLTNIKITNLPNNDPEKLINYNLKEELKKRGL